MSMCDLGTLAKAGKEVGEDLSKSSVGEMYDESFSGTNWQNRLGGQFGESLGGSNWQNRFGGQYDDSWGGGNWMDRMGLGQFKDGMGGGDNSNQGKTDEINALKQVTTGAGFGGSKAAKFSTNKKNAVGKKSLVIKKPSSYRRG